MYANRDLAETGYLVALRFDPNNALAITMLGRLYLDSGRFEEAQAWLGRGIALESPSAATWHAFAIASYYARDLALALWAISRAEDLDASTPAIVRGSALIRAAAGQFRDAEARRLAYEAREPDPVLRRSLAHRIEQWRAVFQSMPEAGVSDRPAARRGAPILAQAPVVFPGAPSPGAAPPGSGPLSPDWSDCVPGGRQFGGGSTDDTAPLQALPSPCAGRPLPRMAVIDTAIIRTEDTRATGKGINLLEQLSLTFTGNLIDFTKTRTRNRDLLAGVTTDHTETRIASQSLTVSLPANLAYSLNIANATDRRAEVLARPSLLALDRQPSTFFSGATLTASVTGQFGGNTVDHPVGVSLAVTPTFIDDDSMLLSVRAARSFFEGANRDLSATVQATRNVVSANVRIRFGETLVLSGLNERETQENESGVPLLKDIPGLQYLFKTETTLDFNKSILILLTPRRPESSASAPQAAPARSSSSEVRELRGRALKALGATPNLDVVMSNLESNVFYRPLRSGDLKAQEWHRADRLERILAEIASFLYY